MTEPQQPQVLNLRTEAGCARRLYLTDHQYAEEPTSEALKAEIGELKKGISHFCDLLEYAQNEIDNLHGAINVLRNDVIELKNEKVLQNISMEEIEQRPEQSTEQDLPANKETDWIVQRERKKKKRESKKRKPNSSPEVDKSTDEDKSEEKNGDKSHQLKKSEKQVKNVPPPINIANVKDFNEIHEVIKSVAGEAKCAIVSQNNDMWKVKAPDSDVYRAITGKLTELKFEWFTYEDKNTRPIKVMARGLHATCKKEDIIQDIADQGLQIEDAVNIIKKEKVIDEKGKDSVSTRKLPLFMLTFKHDESIEKIYNIKTIMSIVVKIEALRKVTNKIPQCKKCQGFNHTQKYCNKQPRCVKCAAQHFTHQCAVSKSMSPKCANCGEQHPANYRGCLVAKTLQRMRNETTKTHKPVTPTEDKKKAVSFTNTANRAPGNHLGQSTSYAQAASGPKVPVKNTMELSINALIGALDQQKKINEALFKRLDAIENATARQFKK